MVTKHQTGGKDSHTPISGSTHALTGSDSAASDESVDLSTILETLKVVFSSEQPQSQLCNLLCEMARQVMAQRPAKDQDEQSEYALGEFFTALNEQTQYYFSAALARLRKLNADFPDCLQFQHQLAIIYCQLGWLEDAIFAYKLCQTTTSHPKLDKWLPSIYSSFQHFYQKIDEKPLYYLALKNIAFDNHTNALHLLREACLCEPDNLDYWNKFSQLHLSRRNWYEAYQAMLPLLSQQLDLQQFRNLLQILLALGEHEKILATVDFDQIINDPVCTQHTLAAYLALAADNPRQLQQFPAAAKFINSATTVKTGTPATSSIPIRHSRKEMDAYRAELGIDAALALLTGIITETADFLPYISTYNSLFNSNIRISMLIQAMTYDKSVKIIAHGCDNNWNTAKINDMTMRHILSSEQVNLIVDISDIANTRHLITVDPELRKLKFGCDNNIASQLGYDAALVSRHMLPTDSSAALTESGWAVSELALTLARKPRISETQLRANLHANTSNNLMLLVAAQANAQDADRIDSIISQLPDDWNCIIDPLYCGGQATLEHTLQRLQLDHHIDKKLIIAKSQYLHAGLAAVIDVCSHPSPLAFENMLANGAIAFSLQRQTVRDRLITASLLHDDLSEMVYPTLDVLIASLIEFCQDQARSNDYRCNFIRRQAARDTQSINLNRINALLQTIQPYLRATDQP